MSGVEILNSFDVVTETAFSWSGFVSAFLIIVVLSLVTGILIGRAGDLLCAGVVTGLVVGVLFGALFGAVVGDMAAEPVAYETRYQVTIDDSVQLNEFLDKYEIVKQEGKIYIVKEKTNE